jgi:hypothetical protein
MDITTSHVTSNASSQWMAGDDARVAVDIHGFPFSIPVISNHHAFVPVIPVVMTFGEHEMCNGRR